MHSLDDVDDPADEPRSFRAHPAWQRIIVLCAGSVMHFLLAFVLIFFVAVGIGIENDNTTQLGTVTTCVAANTTQLDNGNCTASDKASPAKLAGLKVGDQMTAFDGTPVSNWTQLSDVIRKAKPGAPATITVLRDGKRLTLHTTLASVSGRSGAYLGVAPATVFQVANPVRAITYAGSAFWQEIYGAVDAAKALPGSLPALFNKTKRAETAAGQVTSMVGVADVTGQVVGANFGWQFKISFVLLLVAILNIFFGAFNLLPLLPMDGGHVAAIVWERIRAWFARLRHRPDPGLVDISKLIPVMFSLFVVIMFFVVVLVVADIVNPLQIAG